MESSDINILHKGKIPYRKWGRSDKNGLDSGSWVLPSSISIEGKPYMDDRRKEFGSGESIRDSQTNRRRTNEGNNCEGKPWSFDERRDNGVPEEKFRRFFLKPWGHA